MTSVFLSDVHLYPADKIHPGREPFLKFLFELSGQEPGELWILGDLFDYWFEYSGLIPAGYERILHLLRDLSDRGWKTAFLPGNHDWWCGKNLENATGMRVIRDSPLWVSIQGHNCVLAHGDGLGKGDLGYRLIKPILRSPLSIRLFSMVHPVFSTWFAQAFSGTSRRVLRQQTDSVPGFLSDWAESMGRKGADLVITGHTHCPVVQKLPGVMHASLGDWISHFTYLTIRGGEIQLNEFEM